MSVVMRPSPLVETEMAGNSVWPASIGAVDAQGPLNTAHPGCVLGGVPLTVTSTRTFAGVPPSAVTLIVPEPRFGVDGPSTALVDIAAGRKLPLQRVTLPDAARLPPDDAQPLNAITK